MFDIRPAYDFNRETPRAPSPCPPPCAPVGLSDAVDTPDIDNMITTITADARYAAVSAPIVVFSRQQASDAYP